jgi:hypothetical protein
MPHPFHRLARTLTLSSLLLAPSWAQIAHAQDAAPAQAAAQAAASAPALDVSKDPLFTSGTTLYDSALQGRVSKAGLIDYAKLKDNANLATFVAALPAVDVSRFPVFEIKDEEKDKDKDKNVVAGKDKKSSKDGPKMDRSWELSFWINAHNALVLKTLSDAYPIGSPDEIKDFTTRKFAVAGGQYTLEELRQKAGAIDRRAPFAMIDGTQGGPKMAPRALRAYGINDTLESAISAMVNDGRLVELERINNRVAVPPFLATVDEAWKPGASRRKWDGIRYILSAYTEARANRSYYTTNEYQVLLGPPSRKLNIVPSDFSGIS